MSSKQVKSLPKYYYAQTKPAQINSQYIEVQYQVERIVDHRIKLNYRLNYLFDSPTQDNRSLIDIPNHQLEFLIRWKGYGSEDQSWEPGEHLKNAPLLVQQYKSHFKHSMSSKRGTSYAGRPRGRKAKIREVIPKSQEKSNKGGKGFKFNRIYEQNGGGVKQSEEDSDGLQIIDQAAYIQGTKEDHLNFYGSKIKSFELKEKKMNQENQVQQNQVFEQKQNDEVLEKQDSKQDFKQRITLKQDQIMNHDFMDSMPQNYCHLAESNQGQVSHSLSSMLSKQKMRGLDLQQFNRVMQGKKQQKIQIDNPPILQNNNLVIIQNKEKKINQLDIRQFNLDTIQLSQQLHNYQNGNDQKQYFQKSVINLHLQNQESYLQGQNLFKRRHQLQFLPDQTGERIQKKIKTGIHQNLIQCQKKDINEPIEDSQYKIDNDQSLKIFNQDIAAQNNNFGFIFGQIDNVEPINLESSNSVGYNIHKFSLKERIEAQLKSLLQQQPINLQDDSAQQQGNSVPFRLEQKKQPCQNKQNFCLECKKYKQSEKLLVDYFKYYIDQMDEGTANLSFDKIYEQQQTFILVNGLNPHHQIDQSDRVKKLTVLEGQINLQAIICKNEATKDQIDQVIKDYKLAKIVQAKGQWYGVFKALKLNFGKKHYYYIKMRYFANDYKRLIAEFLTNNE